ncbi:MAG: FecR domain-containing protein [Tannerellaceae bacterium]|jgi:ferric-dicitrate binding protein FerR (iron transport regulator)|nr:FecR domain-containing protein [Tannerellaceae bacterium]
MHYLIVKYFKQTITKPERDELFSLMERDERLRKDFISVQNLRALSSLLPSGTDHSIALSKLRQFKYIRRRKSILLFFKNTLRHAALVVLTVAATWGVMSYAGLVAEKDVTDVAYEELTTPAGQRVRLTLHDGTVVWLNARSTLRYPTTFAQGERNVELNGEAFFEVAHNEEQPFVVSTGKLNIKALGTSFNVSAYGEQQTFNTSLIDGSVKVYNKGTEANAMLLESNEYAELENNRLIKRTFDNLDFLLWRDGIYAFDNVSFDDISDKMGWYYDVNIDVRNNGKLRDYKFSGKIRYRDGMESVLRTLQKVYYFSFAKDDELNTITIW